MSEHHGQHARCRACGTNPRSQRPPSPEQNQRAAFEREVSENRKRLTRSDMDRFAKRRSKQRIAEIRAILAERKDTP